MTKIAAQLEVTAHVMLTPAHALLTLTAPNMPACRPGQFVNIRATKSAEAFLRRPISIHNYDAATKSIELLIHDVGPGTHSMCQTEVGESLDCLLPLGNGFSTPQGLRRALLVGGGVGVAPLLLLGSELKKQSCDVTFILGGKTDKDILRREVFEPYGRVCLTTEDGTAGTKGFVTQHPAMLETYDRIYTCGPLPMMKAVAKIAHEQGITCEASLENLMACGIGACLCCVEKTTSGHRCVCTDGPVFDTKDLLWQ